MAKNQLAEERVFDTHFRVKDFFVPQIGLKYSSTTIFVGQHNQVLTA